MTPGREEFYIHPHCRESFIPPALTEGTKWDGTVVLAGLSELKTGYRIARPDHDFTVIFITLSGEGLFAGPEGETNVAAGDLAVVPAHASYSCRLCSDYWKTVWFHLKDLPLWPIPPAMVIRNCLFPEEITRPFAASLNESKKDDKADRTLASLLYRTSLHYLKRELATGKESPRREDKLSALWEKIARDPGQNWTVEEMARVVSLSPRHFSRKTSEFLGRSPHEHLTLLRMDRARFLLKRTDYPLSVIAESLGYENAYSFGAAFRKHWGISPGQCRKVN